MQYSVNTNNSDKKNNETHIYRSPLALNKSLESFLECTTIHQIYNKCLQKPQLPLLGKRQVNPDGTFEKNFAWYTTEKVFDTAEKFGSGLINLGLVEPINEWNKLTLQFVGFYSINTVRLLTADIACGIFNLTIIPLYDTLGEESM